MTNMAPTVQNRLILVEGMAGSGKSTTGQRLYRVYHLNGYLAEFYHEFRRPHHVLGVEEDSVPGWIEQSVSKWRSFVGGVCEHESISIMDGAIFQRGVGELLERDADARDIAFYSHIIADILTAAGPIIIYLYQADVEAALRWVREQRPRTWSKRVDAMFSETAYGRNGSLSGFDLHLDFNRSLRRLSEGLLNTFDVTKLAIDNTDRQWNVHFDKICRFIGIQQMADPLSPHDYCGDYASSENNRQCHIAVTEGVLGVKGLFKIAKNLLPKKGDTLFVETWPDELTFTRDKTGRVVSFRSTGPWNRIGDDVWYRVNTD